MISIEPTLAERRSEYIRRCLGFLDQQQLICPSLNEQVGFDFQGLRQSYRDDPAHPEAQFIARHGRIWIYDIALSIYADLKTGRLRQAGYQVGRTMQLALQEEERGFKGLWHFSYNTKEDPFIDPRGPTGANSWCLNAVYSFILASGDASALSWANRAVMEFFFRQQVMDPRDPRYGLVRAGMYNADDVIGYRVYEGNPNQQYEHVILEHNADVVGTFRLAFRATKRFLPEEKAFLKELIRRHERMVQGMRRVFWQGDHFVSAVDGQGRFYLGTDGLPSIAVDNNTWSAHVFLPYDPELAMTSLRYVLNRFRIQTPAAQIQDLPNGNGAAHPIPDLEGVYYFPASFSDPFVEVQAEHRPKMERLFQLEAAFGLILFMKDAIAYASDPSEKASLSEHAHRLYEDTVNLLQLYGPLGMPYASANVPAVFSTLSSLTTACTGLVAAARLGGAPDGDFIGVSPPEEFLVEGQSPKSKQLV